MAKRGNYIDHEEFKVKIRVSSSINILIQQDMFRFGYLKSNQELNLNLFLNDLLPKMNEHRNNKNRELECRLKKAKITSNMDEEKLRIINNLFFEDYFDSSDEIINLRISKENMKFFDEEKKTSTYIKSLMSEYSNMRLDNRGFLFFNEEYSVIQKAIDENVMITFRHNDEECNFYPIGIEACPIDSDLFIFGLYEKGDFIVIKSRKLCEVDSLHTINRQYDISLTEEMR